MLKWFNSQSRLVQIILLLLPVVNWVIEIGVRWSKYLKDRDILSLLVAILVTFVGVVWGYLDLIWVLLFKHLFLAK